MNHKRPICSVCIANFNGESTILDCLRSVSQQATDVDIEIIVHDDASTDGSVELIKNFPGIILLRSKDNCGFCGSNNKMASVATGDFLLFLNNDAYLEKHSIQSMYERSIQKRHRSIISIPQYDANNQRLLDLGYRLDLFLNPIWNRAREQICYVSGACMWVPRDIWRETGGFPEFFGSVGEDLYLCLAARLLGYQVDMAFSSKVFHHVGQSLGGGNIDSNRRLSTTYRRRFLSERNRLYVMFLTYPLPALFFTLPCLMMIDIVEGALLAILKVDPSPFTKIYLRALRHFISSLPILYEKRLGLQEKKRIGLRTFFKGFIPCYYKIVLFLRHGLPRIN